VVKKSIATVCISGTLEQKIEAIAEAGFDEIEIFEPDLVACPLSPAEIGELVRARGMRISLYQPFRDLEAVSPEVFAGNLERLRQKFEVMGDLGCNLLLLCSNVASATDPRKETAVHQLREAADLAATYGVRIAYEALAWGTYVDDYRVAWDIVREVDHSALGICLDSFHILSKNHPLEPISELPGDKIFILQLADAPQMSLDQLSWSRHHRVFPGEGQFPVAEFVGRSVAAGYHNCLSLEIFNDLFRQADPFLTASDGWRSLAWIESEARSWLTDQGDTDPEGDLAPLVSLNEAETVTFVELGGPRDQELVDTLSFFGFERVGSHQSKLIELWSHGGARIIVNPGAGSATDPYVAGLGFAVDDLVRAATRAAQLGLQPLERTTQAGETDITGFRSPDGTEVYLDQRDERGIPQWWAEFAAEPQTTGHRVIGIDHVNLSQPWHYFDSAVLFYTSLLSLRAQESLDVAAPLGLVRSQVMRNASGSVRLALNVFPPREESTPPAQHIAFATDDIFSLARSAQQRGIKLLPVGDNYYRDLEARFALPPAQVVELKELHLLYDRDGQGEFFHLYTQNFGGLFLEVVERRAGYEGYGAPNAPIRLAAQHRSR
jgi:4-hydroxyphenylpyruvate dioxygenase